MSSTSGISGAIGQQVTTGHDAYQELDIDSFISLLVAELQNQDPMEPMKNSDIVNQVSQIRAIQSNQYLTTTLTGVMLGQNLNTASTLIDRTVNGLDDTGKEVTGKVTGVSMNGGSPKLHIGDQIVSLQNVRKILNEADATDTTTDTTDTTDDAADDSTDETASTD